ncbi:ABC transporter permease subunit [Paenibacillus sp. sgz500958]|uniref:ABC transporter permease subunit n=1 Tax=Paenibacillus sp. sgz500958 TaxID=3242475 RepID=UPI0036D29172
MSMTWKELLRKKVMLLTLILTGVFLLAFWFVAGSISDSTFTMGMAEGSGEQMIARFADGAIILTLGFFFGAFVIAFLAIFSSSSALAGEAEVGVLQALLPRPLPRWKWYLGRWLGYVTLGMGYALLLFMAIVSIADAHASIPGEPASLIKAFLLFSSVVPMLVSISMLGSGIFSAIGNGVFMTMLYGAGWLGGTIDKMSGSLDLKPDIAESLRTVTGIMSLLMPADGLQRKMLAELFSLDILGDMVDIHSFAIMDISVYPSGAFVGYAMFYIIAVFLLGMWLFQRRDF